MQKTQWYTPIDVYRKANTPAQSNLTRLFLSKIPQPVSRLIQNHPFVAAVVAMGVLVCAVWALSKFWQNPTDTKPTSPLPVPKVSPKDQNAYSIFKALYRSSLDLPFSYIQETFRKGQAPHKELEKKISSDFSNAFTQARADYSIYDLSKKLGIDDLSKLYSLRDTQYVDKTPDTDKLIHLILGSYLEQHFRKKTDVYETLTKMFAIDPRNPDSTDQVTLAKLGNFLEQAKRAENPSALWRTELGQYLQVIWLVESYRIFVNKSNPSEVDEWTTELLRLWIVHKLQNVEQTSLTGFCFALKRESEKSCPEQKQLQVLFQCARAIFIQKTQKK